MTSRLSQPPLALAVPLSRFTPRVGGCSVFFFKQHSRREKKQLHLVNSMRHTCSNSCPILYVLLGAQKARRSHYCAGVVLLLL
jgi:hypothetical protein